MPLVSASVIHTPMYIYAHQNIRQQLTPQMYGIKRRGYITHLYPLVVSIGCESAEVDRGDDPAWKLERYEDGIDIPQISDVLDVRLRHCEHLARELSQDPTYDVDVVHATVVEHAACIHEDGHIV